MNGTNRRIEKLLRKEAISKPLKDKIKIQIKGLEQRVKNLKTIANKPTLEM